MNMPANASTGAVATYSCRSNLLTSERRYELTPDALIWSDSQTTGRIPYVDIRVARVACTLAFGNEFWRCVLRSYGHRTLVIPSMHYRSLGRFDNRFDTFAPFVTELLLKVAKSNASARFFYREGWSLWVTNLLLFFFMVTVLAFAALVIFYEPLGFPGYIALFALITFLPSVWRTVSAGPPREIHSTAVVNGELPF
jgi:hypothetical protein